MTCTTRWSFRIVCLLGLLAVGAPSAAQDSVPVLLRLHLEPGMSYRMSVATETRTMMAEGDSAPSTLQFNEVVSLLEVLSVDENQVAWVRMTYERVHALTNGPMGRTEYRSTDPDSVVPQTMTPFAGLVGKTMTMGMAPDGTAQDVEGMEGMFSTMLEGMDSIPQELRDEVAEDMEDLFGESMMTGLLEQVGSAYPPGPISVGDSWEHSMDVQDPVPVEGVMTSTLVSRRDGVASIEISGTMVQKGVMEMGSMRTEFDLSGTITGQQEMDEETGLPLFSRTEHESSGTMAITDELMGSMSMPMRSTVVTTTRLLPGN